jgi:hypothetical protein
MKVFKYESYEHYVAAQQFANNIKVGWVYVRESTIEFIKRDKPEASNIIAHGTRNGAEQKFFKKFYPEAFVIGSEISDTAKNYPMTVQQDFSIIRPEWVDKFDILYSNSFDHTILPIGTLQVWKDQLNSSGRMYLEYAESQSIGDASDPLEATKDEVQLAIKTAGFKVVHIEPGMKHGGVLFVCEKE